MTSTNKNTQSPRRRARENAMKILFERLSNEDVNPITVEAVLEGADVEEKTYAVALLDGVFAKYDFFKDAVSSYVTTYAADRIYRIDLSLMMIAAFEIIGCDDIPDKVAVNEAIEIAKKYSTEKSPAFINGVLASVIRDKQKWVEEYHASEEN